jgi:uncharacterized protein YukE
MVYSADSSIGNATSFTIEEQTGQQRSLILTARALPYRPFQLTGNMRVSTTWYPGNPEATVQLLGTSEDATSINGTWKQRFIGDPSSPAKLSGSVGNTDISTVQDLVSIVDDIRKQGQLLKVTWDFMVRFGIMTKFVQTWFWHEELEWNIEFTWISLEEPSFSSSSPAIVASLSILRADTSDIATKIQTNVNSIKSALKNFQAQISTVQEFAQSVNDIVASIEGTITQIINTISNSIESVINVVESAQNILSLINFVIQKANQLISTTEAQVDRAIVAAQKIATIPASTACSASELTHTTKSSARAIISNAADLQQSFEGTIQHPFSTQYKSLSDQDVRAVSVKFYGTPDLYQKIMIFNNLKDSRLSAGQIIYIPQTFS